ncbi:portal protein [Leptospira kobayashii]|uniref:Portal protein n=1 Tax=Leptospira kobayashii TaxID=1917830 RepID=A0ABM7UF94_9LEPT|nr:portal protein [Leptospira kobayashii]
MKVRRLLYFWILFLGHAQTWKHQIRKFYLEHFRSLGRFIYTTTGVISIAILILEFGFYYPEEWKPIVRLAVYSMVRFFLIYEIIGFLFCNSPWDYLKAHKLEFIIVLLLLVENFYEEDIILFLKQFHLTGGDATLIFLSTNQILFIFANLAHFFRLSRFYDAKNINPSFVFVGSFATIILFGTIFLHFPKATYKQIPTIDLVFTTVSATCVTGLSTISIADSFTLTGKIIILFLIQIGGLGLMTLTSFFSMFLAGQASVTDKLLLKDLLSEEAIGKVKGLLKQIAYQTIFIELIGAVLLYISFPKSYPMSEFNKIFFAIFHSISAFCNAGFSLLPAGLADPSFMQTESFLSTIMLLIVLGGLGFPVLSQIHRRLTHPKDVYFRWSVTSKLVFITTLVLLLIGTLAYYVLEKELTLKSLSTADRIFHSLFYSVTTRTAGFNTLDLAKMGIPVTFFSLFLMWVGASPISTGGGIKTTTLAISVFNIINQIRGKSDLEVYHRSIAPSTIHRAGATIVLSLFVIFTAIFGLVVFESFSFLDISYEVVSAFGTVGLTRGITPYLSVYSKGILCIVMFVGRVGILTLLVALSKKAISFSYKYPVEYVVVG